jgi:hypothetical protein
MKLNRFLSLQAVLLLSCTLAISSCGKKSDDYNLDDDTEQEGGGDAGAATIDPATAATITGTVNFEGAAPAPEMIDMSADQVCMANSTPETREKQEVMVKDGKLANVFVYVSKGLDGKFKPPTEPAVLDQHGCAYHPHVLGVMVGQPLEITNSDETLHNIHPTPQKNKAFNLAQPTKGSKHEVTFDQEEVMIPVSCDVHGWMRSYVGVLPHPAFATSGTDGKFSFKAPPGTYTITAWHEKLGKQEQQVTVGASETKDLTFTFKAQ